MTLVTKLLALFRPENAMQTDPSSASTAASPNHPALGRPSKKRLRIGKMAIEIGEVSGMKRVVLHWQGSRPISSRLARAESHRLAATVEEVSGMNMWTVYLTDVDRCAEDPSQAKGGGVAILTFERDQAEVARALAVLEAVAATRGLIAGRTAGDTHA